MTYSNDDYLVYSLKYLEEIDTLYFQVKRCNMEYLPEELNLEYKDKIVENFKLKLEKLFSRMQQPYNFTDYKVQKVLNELKEIKNPFITKRDLKDLHEKAVERTLSERILQYNKLDVNNFFQALRNVCLWECRLHLVGRIKYLLYGIPSFKCVIENYF